MDWSEILQHLLDRYIFHVALCIPVLVRFRLAEMVTWYSPKKTYAYLSMKLGYQTYIMLITLRSICDKIFGTRNRWGQSWMNQSFAFWSVKNQNARIKNCKSLLAYVWYWIPHSETFYAKLLPFLPFRLEGVDKQYSCVLPTENSSVSRYHFMQHECVFLYTVSYHVSWDPHVEWDCHAACGKPWKRPIEQLLLTPAS